MGSIKRQPTIIKYKDSDDPKTKYIDTPKIINDDYSFQMQFGFVYPYKNYEEPDGVKSYYVKGLPDK